MKISTLDSSNFRLYNGNNSIDGRNLSAQDIKKKLGLEDVKYSIAKIGESHTFEEDTRDVVQLSARAKSSVNQTGASNTEQSATVNLLAAIDDATAAKGWTLDQYYRLLFKLDAKEANMVFGKPHSISSSGLPDTVEQTTARYNELREQVMKEFSHYKGLLEEHLAALDKGFEAELVSNAVGMAAHLAAQQLFMSTMKKDEYSEDEFHPLAQHKNFNKDDFAANARELMKQFAQKYTQQLMDNVNNFSAAWENTLKLMSETKTTSVNNLSFNDFKILEETLSGKQGSEYMTRKQAAAAYGDLYADFRNHEGMSDYLRSAISN